MDYRKSVGYILEKIVELSFCPNSLIKMMLSSIISKCSVFQSDFKKCNCYSVTRDDALTECTIRRKNLW